MNDIATADTAFVFFPEALQRDGGIAHPGFHFDGIYFVLRFTVIGNNEIDFNIVASFFPVIVGIEKQAVAVGGQHLRNGVFIEHSFVQAELAAEDLFVDFVLQQLVFVKGVADEEAGVSHITLEEGVGFRKRKSDIGIVGAATFVCDHGIGQPKKSVLVLSGIGFFRDTVENHTLFVRGKQPRNLILLYEKLLGIFAIVSFV